MNVWLEVNVGDPMQWEVWATRYVTVMYATDWMSTRRDFCVLRTTKRTQSIRLNKHTMQNMSSAFGRRFANTNNDVLALSWCERICATRPLIHAVWKVDRKKHLPQYAHVQIDCGSKGSPPRTSAAHLEQFVVIFLRKALLPRRLVVVVVVANQSATQSAQNM